MEKKTNGQQGELSKGRHEHPLPQEISGQDRKLAEAAHKAADSDISEDADLSASSPNDDLDEGEAARLGEETDLI